VEETRESGGNHTPFANHWQNIMLYRVHFPWAVLELTTLVARYNWIIVESGIKHHYPIPFKKKKIQWAAGNFPKVMMALGHAWVKIFYMIKCHITSCNAYYHLIVTNYILTQISKRIKLKKIKVCNMTRLVVQVFKIEVIRVIKRFTKKRAFHLLQ
jgi:hypothetical protein